MGTVNQRDIRRIYRNNLGDWCAEVIVDERVQMHILEYHPSAAMMRELRAGGTDIADDVLDEGAEGQDIRQHARRADD